MKTNILISSNSIQICMKELLVDKLSDGTLFDVEIISFSRLNKIIFSRDKIIVISNY